MTISKKAAALNLWLNVFDLKATAWCKANCLQPITVQLEPTAVTLTQIGEGLPIIFVHLQTQFAQMLQLIWVSLHRWAQLVCFVFLCKQQTRLIWLHFWFKLCKSLESALISSCLSRWSQTIFTFFKWSKFFFAHRLLFHYFPFILVPGTGQSSYISVKPVKPVLNIQSFNQE